MFPYADYDFYVEKVHGKQERESFEKEVLEASFFLRYLTQGKSDKVQMESLSYAACAIAEMYVEQKQKAAEGSLGKKSESTDGYSVSYSSEIGEGETCEIFLGRKAQQIARKYLSVTGLLDRKVRCGHADQCGYDTL